MEKPIIDYIFVFAMPIGTIFVGIVLGWLFKRFIHQRLKKITEKTGWKGDDIIFDAIDMHPKLLVYNIGLILPFQDISFNIRFFNFSSV